MTFLRKHARLGTLLFIFGSSLRPFSAPAAVQVTVGQNFLGSTFNVNSDALPPDANGVIGPRHFVEFINGSFAVYNKTNGTQVKRIADTKFWSNAGVILSSSDAVTDPRIVYDPTSQRWFASMVDLDAAAAANGQDPTLESNDFLLGVSDTSDPTGTWHGYLFPADPDTGYFADFPTLGVDSNAVYLSGDFYQGEMNPLGAGLVSFPKSDLLASPPKFNTRTWFGVMPYAARGEVLQPASCFDGSVTGAILSASDIGNDSNPHSNIVSFAVQNGGSTHPTLTAPTLVPTPSWVVPDNSYLGVPQFSVVQPDGTDTLVANDARLAAKSYAVGGILYATHNTQLNGRLAIRWYRIRASDNALLEAGTLADPNLDLSFPCIAANQYGVVVLGFNACGPGSYLGCYAVAGQTVNGATSFGDRILLQSSSTSYHDLYEELGLNQTSRWGDYLTASVDPADPNRFWTIQMYPSDSDVWSTQITEVITSAQPALAIQSGTTTVVLSWPNAFTGYQLQSATNLLTPVWANVGQTPQTNGALASVTLPVAPGQKYFRLHHP